eukprot:m.156997 g.156997  ORF g.156997 m.156997 type:complete len:200 (-) comp14450_c0_seq2:91-690(-)
MNFRLALMLYPMSFGVWVANQAVRWTLHGFTQHSRKYFPLARAYAHENVFAALGPPNNTTLTNRFREWVCGRGTLDAHADSVREWRVRVAMATVGVPISWSAITTAGSAGFLMTCNLVLFRRLGEILVFNTVVGWTFSVIVLPAILSSVGPRPFEWTLRRCIGAVGGLGVAVAAGTLVLYLAWKAHPQAIQNSRGKSLF